jgi:hypothetical protein
VYACGLPQRGEAGMMQALVIRFAEEIVVSDLLPPPPPPVRVERYASAVVGLVLLLIGVSLWGWGVRLGAAALRTDAPFPPGLNELLLPVALTAVLVGFGAWRILKLGLPERVAGLTLGWAALAMFALATVVGAFM